MISDKSQPGSWMSVVSIVLAFSGAMVSITAAIAFYISQAQSAFGFLWPLPGLVLLEWAVLGAGGFCAAYLSTYKGDSRWQGRLWAISGALIPLIVLGAFSIGTLVLIVFILFLVSAILTAVHRGTTALSSLGMILIGSILNALVLYAIIIAANPVLFNHPG